MYSDDSISRRRLLTGLAGSATLAGCAAAMPTRERSAATALEQANEKLVNDFCAAWALRDVDALLPYLDEKLVYQMFEGRPDLVGIQAFSREIGPFLRRLREVRWDVLRSCAVGQLVINERVDYFFAPAGGRDMIFPIAGLFVVQDNKITLWRDYRMPGTKPGAG